MPVSLLLLATCLVAFLLASFWIWKNLRGEYSDAVIFSTTLLLALVVGLTVLGWRWWSVGGTLVWSLLTLSWWCRIRHLDFWELADAILPASTLAGSLIALGTHLDLWPAILLLLVSTVLLVLIKKYYRRLAWYKSGKLGIVAIAGIALWNVVWLLIAKWHPLNLYWGGLSVEQWIAIWAIIACTVTVYLRGGRRVTQDWRSITKLWQPKLKKTKA